MQQLSYSYVFVLITVFSTVITQLSFKKLANSFQHVEINSLINCAFSLFFNHYFLIGVTFSFLSIVSWIIALKNISLSQAYPCMSLTFPLVLLVASLFFGEEISIAKCIGTIFIVIGLIFIFK